MGAALTGRWLIFITGHRIHLVSHCLLLLVSLKFQLCRIFATNSLTVAELSIALKSLRQTVTLYLLSPIADKLGIPRGKKTRFLERECPEVLIDWSRLLIKVAIVCAQRVMRSFIGVLLVFSDL